MNACALETNVSTLPFIVHTLEKTCTTQILYEGKKTKKTNSIQDQKSCTHNILCITVKFMQIQQFNKMLKCTVDFGVVLEQ